MHLILWQSCGGKHCFGPRFREEKTRTGKGLSNLLGFNEAPEPITEKFFELCQRQFALNS